MNKRNWIVFALADFLFLAAGVIFLFFMLTKPLSIPKQGFLLTVEKGSSLSRVGSVLSQQGYMDFYRVVVLYAKVMGKTDIKLGEYQLAAGINSLKLLEQLNEGDVVQHQITLIEGFTVKQILEALQQEEILEKKLSGLSKAEIVLLLGIKEKKIEGLFFPDTYQYTLGNSDQEILQQAYQRMQKVLNEEWEKRAENAPYNLPYKNPYEALIMASIIEKETGVPEERSAIAGVFVRRLNKGMRLQTDPTVIYGLGASYRGNIKRRHLQQDTLYNTYTRHGLPPTPIALAGREAIHAALHPEEGDSLYFVGKGDGSHQFSATLAEHQKAVRQYQLRRKKDYHSSPKRNELK